MEGEKHGFFHYFRVQPIFYHCKLKSNNLVMSLFIKNLIARLLFTFKELVKVLATE